MKPGKKDLPNRKTHRIGTYKQQWSGMRPARQNKRGDLQMRNSSLSNVVLIAAAGAAGWVVLSNLGTVLVLTAVGAGGIYAMNKLLKK